MSIYRKSPINYVGNKYRLLPQLISLFPDKINTFCDLFGGSGTVLLNVKANNYIYNDINPYVVNVFQGLYEEESADHIISLVQNVINEYGLNAKDKEPFERLRADYNKGRKDWITLYTLMCFSFNGQFRFNSRHEYNSSFGKRSFNENHEKHIREMKDFTSDIMISDTSFQDFSINDLRWYCDQDSLIYCDPPYYNSTGNFNDGKRGFEGWSLDHEKSLLALLDKLDEAKIPFALSNNLQYDNPILREWLQNNKYQVHHLDIDYSSCSHQKKDRIKGDEVLITNYIK